MGSVGAEATGTRASCVSAALNIVLKVPEVLAACPFAAGLASAMEVDEVRDGYRPDERKLSDMVHLAPNRGGLRRGGGPGAGSCGS